MFEPVRSSSGKLLFKLDPERLLVEVQDRGMKTIVDLTQHGLKPCTCVGDCKGVVLNESTPPAATINMAGREIE